ncbi:glycosyltransferase family 2 protein [Campylobacter hyointestinalis]|uniref:Glycosyl transferase n=1 Tax=Campylobacter hyointestinalis subsp. hyointestinalis TaxID=91352 RepID=A0A855NA28_CAMHY|nr:glycosyltransferase family 2 protein [Campylobacter hyointestinalis]ANE32066.1 glycosyltransferase, family 2 [Campylobacter hyointestinalis subsp. hyointestinalis LMG 9260]KEA44426.1 glycosyl transferase [Campylobacter hyointestinalis subsp. hyointestinalis]PPB58493.1 glycosyl transferase [Campylobacter hyointestinalis subsp. hyointestinalis]PPB62888.1 glycosyl transferase [Campylobacter hyointestinalis subsp. hyointestinalis]PPB71346.1 glycosyl transferase [Campylobacter hyointestinalis su
MISFIVLTFNSEKYLKEVLSSISWTDEIVVVDSGSNDKTLKICSEFKNVKITCQKWLGFGAQKQLGVDLSKNEWIFVLDSDEVITKELKNEIIDELKNPKFKAYKIARLNYFFGKPIRKMGLYPDYTIRFFNKNYAKFDGRSVHESVITNSKIGVLKNHFIHHAYESVEQFINKQNSYSSLNKKSNRIKAVLNPCWTFFKLYILKGGFLEGWNGFIIAKLYSEYTFWKYIK